MVRGGRSRWVVGACVASVLVPGAAVHGEPSGGRLVLQEPQIVYSTDPTASTRGPLALGSFDEIIVLGATEPGEVYVDPCGGPQGEPIASYAPSEIVHLPVTGAGDCVTTSTPVQLRITRLGSIQPTPTTGGLQYVPLTAPVVLTQGLRADVPAGDHEQLSLTNVPAAARAAVVLVESYDLDGRGGTSSLVGSCPGANGVSANSPGPGLAIGYLPITTPTAGLCAWYTGGPFARVTVLGYLSVDGPDPTRLPPTLGLTDLDVLPPGLAPITPTRVLDTRSPIGVPAAGRVEAGSVTVLDLSAEITADSTGAVFNLAVTEPIADGYVTAYPCDADRPTAANINFVAGETVSNLVTVKLSDVGTVCLYSLVATHLVADLTATYELFAGAGIQAVVPARVLDTRNGTGVPAGKVLAGHSLVVDVSGPGGTPETGVDAVTLNIAVTEPDGAGFVTAWPCNEERPTAANLNFVAGQTVPNAVTVGVSAQGTVCLYTHATTHLVADLSAWFGADNADGFDALVPDRLLDTRVPIGTAVAQTIPAGGTLTLQVAGRAGVPDDIATAVVMNVAVTQPNLDGYLTVYPCDDDRPLAANLNFDRGETVSNQVTAKLSAEGTVCIYAQRRTHVVADVAGYFSSDLSTIRVLDLVE